MAASPDYVSGPQGYRSRPASRKQSGAHSVASTTPSNRTRTELVIVSSVLEVILRAAAPEARPLASVT